MFLYGGPGSQQVLDSWGGTNYMWYQMLCQKGYIVVCVDNRGTGARGAEFKKMTHLQLGKYETIDQIESATLILHASSYKESMLYSQNLEKQMLLLTQSDVPTLGKGISVASIMHE